MAISQCLIGPISSVLLCFFHPGNPKVTAVGVFLMINFLVVAFAQGILLKHYLPLIQKGLTDQFSDTLFVPFYKTLGISFLLYLFFPTVDHEVGLDTLYPMYIDTGCRIQ
jgi:hypothetical protein